MAKYNHHPSNLYNLGSLRQISGDPRPICGSTFFHNKDITNSESIQKLEHFVSSIKNGFIPDGKVLEFMADCLGKYLSEEKFTLEDSFKLKSIIGKGNAAKDYNMRKKEHIMFLEMLDLQAEKKISQNKAAEKVLRKHDKKYKDNDEKIYMDSDNLARNMRGKLPNSKHLKQVMKEKFYSNKGKTEQ